MMPLTYSCSAAGKRKAEFTQSLAKQTRNPGKVQPDRDSPAQGGDGLESGFRRGRLDALVRRYFKDV